MEHGRESPLQIDVSRAGVVATLTATGELDITTATVLTERLLAVAAGTRNGWSWTSAAWSSSMPQVRGHWMTCTRSCKPCARSSCASHGPARNVFAITGLMENSPAP